MKRSEVRKQDGSAMVLDRAFEAALCVARANEREDRKALRAGRMRESMMARARRQVERELRRRFGDPYRQAGANLEDLRARYPHVNWLEVAIHRLGGLDAAAAKLERSPCTIRGWLSHDIGEMRVSDLYAVFKPAGLLGIMDGLVGAQLKPAA